MPTETRQEEVFLEVSHLNFSYGEKRVLTDVNFVLQKGQFAALVGANGTGKTSLMKLMLGFLKPQEGTVTIQGLPPSHPSLAGKIGYVPQTLRDVNPHFPASLREIVAGNFYAQGRAWTRAERRRRRAQVDAILEQMGLGGRGDDHLDMLSGGQLQKLLLARALVSEPEILFLDEPTAGIDSDASEEIHGLLKELNEERGLTIVLISHDLYRIKGLCQRCLCLAPERFFEVSPEAYGSSEFYRCLYGKDR